MLAELVSARASRRTRGGVVEELSGLAVCGELAGKAAQAQVLDFQRIFFQPLAL